MESQQQFPASLDAVEALVLQLYEPGAPERVVHIQETLQRLQRSSEGWQLADHLLGNADEKIRFFGALTFIVKLNTDAESLSEEGAQAVLQTLILWILERLRNGEGQLVLRKLCAALVAYFLQFSASWTECVLHLLYCLSIDRVVPYSALVASDPDTDLVQGLSNEKSIAVLWFATSLVDEVGRTDPNSIKHHSFHQRIVPNLVGVVSLVTKYITNNVAHGLNDVKARQESLKCLQAWISYAHRIYVDEKVVLEPLRQATKPAILSIMDDDLYDVAVELLCEVLTSYPTFLKNEDLLLLRSVLNGAWAAERYKRLVCGDYEFDSLQFGLLNIAFGDATIKNLAQNLHSDPQSQQFLHGLVGLLDAHGAAVLEDRIFVPALEFWNSFVENVGEWAGSEVSVRRPPWFIAAQGLLMTVIQHCWRKVQFPPDYESGAWDSTDRTAFQDARRDLSDLLEQCYLLQGLPLLKFFVDLLRISLSRRSWTELEATIFCLSQFSDCIRHEDSRDDYLSTVFTATLFDIFHDPDNDIPPRCMQTFLGLVDAYADYFERHDQYLAKVLSVAFDVTTSPVLSKPAARSIVRLCSPCRRKLIPMIDVFLDQYRKISRSSHVESHTKEGILEAMATIIQAIPEDAYKTTPLQQLLYFLNVDIEVGLESLAQASVGSVAIEAEPFRRNVMDPGLPVELLLTSLRCLVSIAKGLRAPADFPVDLERKDTLSSFWTAGDGSIVQHRILGFLEKIYDALDKNSEAMELVCYVLRMGLRESEPGPFVFHVDIIAGFLIKASSRTKRPGTLVATACSILSSLSSRTRSDEVIHALLVWLAGLFQDLGEPSGDPETAQNGIDFMNRLVPGYLNILLSHQPPSSLESLFLFTLKALSGSEPLPKSAAADFWSSFVGVSSLEDGLQKLVDGVLIHMGPLLAQALVYNIGGNAARSELEKLSEPVKKVVTRQAKSKAWFEAALLSERFPSKHVPVKERMVFLQKIMSLRGARGTSQIVRDFWLTCRGSNFAYAS